MREELLERRELRTGPRPVRNGNHESDGDGAPLGESLAFDLTGAKLRLHIHQRSFDFNLDRLILTREENVGRPTVTWANRRLDAGGPGAVQRRKDGLGHAELPRVTKGNSIYGIEAKAELVADGGGHAAPGQQRGAHVATFSLTDDLLADT